MSHRQVVNLSYVCCTRQYLALLLALCLFELEKIHADHFCAKLASGNLQKIHLEAVFFWRSHHLVLLESNKLYFVERELINIDSVIISSTPVSEVEEEIRQLRKTDAVDEAATPTPHSGFMLGGQFYLFYSNSTHEVWFKYGSSFGGQVLQAAAKRQYRLSIITDGLSSEYYVLTDNPNSASSRPFALYQMSFTVNGWQSLPGKDLKQDSAELFYLENTRDPMEISIVSQSTLGKPEQPSDASKQMFLQKHFPLGFMHQDSVFLLELNMGCVFILANLGSKAFNPKKNITRKRINLPFEEFFVCDETKFPRSSSYDPNRCDLKYTATPLWIVIWTKFKYLIICLAVLFSTGIILLAGAVIISKLSNRKKKILGIDTSSDSGSRCHNFNKKTLNTSGSNLAGYKSAQSAFSETSKSNNVDITKKSTTIIPFKKCTFKSTKSNKMTKTVKQTPSATAAKSRI